ncbi:hypothetical protein FIBSPDRAFT_863091, partial [Athelia psychrophila]
ATHPHLRYARPNARTQASQPYARSPAPRWTYVPAHADPPARPRRAYARLEQARPHVRPTCPCSKHARIRTSDSLPPPRLRTHCI